MGFMVNQGSVGTDLPYLRAAVDQAGQYFEGKYAAARDMLALAVLGGSRLRGAGLRRPSSPGLVLVAGLSADDHEAAHASGAAAPDVAGRPGRPRSRRADSADSRSRLHTMRHDFLG